MAMQQARDIHLINLARAGDPAAFSDLADRYYMTVYRYAYRWCGNRQDAEDISQEVFIRLAGNIHKFDGRARFSSWLYRVTANCAVDYARRNRKWRDSRAEQLPDDLAASPNPGPEHNVLARNILAVVESLPAQLKEVMLLVYGEGMSHREAAEIIGCAESTVSWRIFKAKRKLRKELS